MPKKKETLNSLSKSNELVILNSIDKYGVSFKKDDNGRMKSVSIKLNNWKETVETLQERGLDDVEMSHVLKGALRAYIKAYIKRPFKMKKSREGNTVMVYAEAV